MGPLSLEEAEDVLRRAAPSTGSVTVPVEDALGRVARAEVASPGWLPPFDTSAMDGYAALAEGGRRRKLVGSAYAGDPWEGTLQDGETVFVATGAPVPPEAGVLPQERVRLEAGEVVFERLPEGGENVRRRGEEIAPGELLIRASQRVDAGSRALLASLGVERLVVARPPRILVIATGSELSERPRRLGQIRNTNGPWLQAKAASVGAQVEGVVVPDDQAVFADATEARLPRADVVLTTGGISVGPKDHVSLVATRLGFHPLFRGILARPGGPLSAFAREDGKVWVALPGNPLSTAVGFDRLVRPMMAAMEGRPSEAGLTEGVLVASLGPNRSDRPRLWPARLGLQRRIEAEPQRYAASGSVSALAGLGGWILLPPGSAPKKAGDTVEIWVSEGIGCCGSTS